MGLPPGDPEQELPPARRVVTASADSAPQETAVASQCVQGVTLRALVVVGCSRRAALYVPVG